MSVNFKTFGIVGVHLNDSKETNNRLIEGLSISREELKEKYWDSLSEYFEKKGLGVSVYDNNHKGTYRIVFNNRIVRPKPEGVLIGLVLFENDTDEPYYVNFYEFKPINNEEIQNKIKELFGLEISKDEIKTFIFTHTS